MEMVLVTGWPIRNPIYVLFNWMKAVTLLIWRTQVNWTEPKITPASWLEELEETMKDAVNVILYRLIVD